jgi:hypothetical protein
MARHNGKPSGANKSEDETGLRPGLPLDEVQQDKEMTEKYTENEEQIAKNVHVRHPNRNTNKTDATNAGGYKQ